MISIDRGLQVPARKSGLTLNNGEEHFHHRPERLTYVRPGFASLNEKEMKEAVAIMKKATEKNK